MKAKNFNARRFKFGSLATIISIVVIVALVIVNIIAGLLLERFPVKIDLTTNQKFKLTQQSVDFVKNINDEVRIIVCADENEYKSASDLFKQSYEIMKNYESYNPKVKVSFVNLTKNPTFAQKYPAQTLEAGQVIVETDKRYKVLAPNDLFTSTTDQDTQTTQYQSQAEQALTGAIMNVTDANPTTVTVLKGQSDVDVSALETLLKSNSYTIEEKDILTDKLDATSTILVIPQPKSDFTLEQVEKINNFLSNDGKYGKSVYFLAAPTAKVGDVLKNFLADWGMEISSEILVETNQSNMVGYANNIISKIANEDVAKKMTNNSLPLVLPNSRAVKTLFDEKDTRKTTVIASTYETAGLAAITDDGQFDTNNIKKGTYNTIVKCSRTNNTGTEELTSNVVVFGSSQMFDSSVITSYQMSDGDIALTVANQLAGKDNAVSIVPVDMSTGTITVTSQQILMARIILMGVIPGLIIIAGIVVWVRRRHL